MSETSVKLIDTLPPLPERPADAHKGTFGRALLIAGSRGMSGAACLSGFGAIRGGAGLVSLAVPEAIVNIVATVNPCWMTVPCPCDSGGCISAGAVTGLAELWPKQSAVALGPGLGTTPDIQTIVRGALKTCPVPFVLDADALNALAQMGCDDPNHKPAQPGQCVLTPHPGEFARLTGHPPAVIAANRESLAADFARSFHGVVLLKGARTVITDGQRLAINSTGNSGMATGGSGDVLTGLIVALLAQGMPAFEAAQLAAHLHGLAGDLAAQQSSHRAISATEIHESIGAAWRQLDSLR